MSTHPAGGNGTGTPTAPHEPVFVGETRAALERLFGGRIDVLLYAGTHAPRIASADGIFLVGPGSPTLAVGRAAGKPGHVALVELADGIASARIVDLAA